jgi:hypothetical protein
MTTTRSLLLLAALSPTCLLLPGCGKTDSAPTSAAPTTATDIKAAAADTWDSIKDYTHDKRADFAAALDRMADKGDAGIRAMNAKLAGLPDAAAKAQDSAGKEFAEALANLKTQTTNLRAATAETWADAKEQAAQSWRRMEAAYEKLKPST